MGELAVAAVGLAPLLEQGQDLLGLLGQQPVQRRSARWLVSQRATGPAAQPAMGPDLPELQGVTAAAQRPAGLDGVVEQREEPRLGGRVDPAWDTATQPQAPFPSTSVSLTAISLTASDSRATSALASSSS